MIKIVGVIGNEDKQYSLVRLIQDVKKEPENHPIHILISSPGGDAGLSFDMHDYLRGLGRKIITECKVECASAASILFLAGDERIAGCPIMIHNPWMQASGDSEKLREAADWIENFEKRAEKFYEEKTKLDSKTLSNLMKVETYLSPKQSVSLGFATKSKQIAMALINTNTNLNSKKMANKKEIPGWKKKLIMMLLGEDIEENANMLDLTTAAGETIVIDREEGEPQVGDNASPDGSHVMPDGSTIVVVDGVITEITPADGGSEEIEQLKAENERLKAEIATMKAGAKTVDEIAQLNAIKIAGGKDWLAKQCSHYKPASRKTTTSDNNELSATAQKLAEVKAAKGLK